MPGTSGPGRDRRCVAVHTARKTLEDDGVSRVGSTPDEPDRDWEPDDLRGEGPGDHDEGAVGVGEWPGEAPDGAVGLLRLRRPDGDGDDGRGDSNSTQSLHRVLAPVRWACPRRRRVRP